MKAHRFVIVWILILLLAGTSFAAAATAEPRLEAESAILIDMTTGDVLYEKAADRLQYPASTTKIITCLLALKHLDPESELIIDDQVPKTEGNSIGLQEGEKVRVKDLLYALMTVSSNDSAEALAIAISGSVSEFSVLMKEFVEECGASHSRFVNPHGLHDPVHRATARDLALIAARCMEHEEFRNLARTVSYTMNATNKSGPRSFTNTNRLLWDEQDATRIYVNGVLRHCKYDGTIGVKTGYTSHAQGCLISVAERDGTTLLSVVLHSSDLGRFADSIALFDWGFENYKTLCVIEEGVSLGTVRVRRGAVRRVEAIPGRCVAATVPTEASESVLSTNILLDPSVRAPIAAGQRIGDIELLEGGHRIAVFPAVASVAVDEGGWLSIFSIEDRAARIITKALLVLLIVLIVILIIYILVKRRQVKKRKEERARRRHRQLLQEQARRREWEELYERRLWEDRGR